MSKQGEKIIDTHPDLCVKLEQYCIIEVVGEDAEKYLQGQLTCDVAKLPMGEQTLTCHCNPKGKMSSLFRLYRQRTDQFFIIILKALLPEALVQLRKYAVFSKVTFIEREDLIYGTTDNGIFAKYREKATACTLTESPNRHLIWGNIELETNGKGELWDLMDIQQGIPILHPVNQFELIPQATNLQKLEQAISFTKGCYIGQETIARAKYRGANKRAMFTFVGEFLNADLPEIAGNIEMQIGENWKATGLILSRFVEQNNEQNRLWLQVVLNKEIEPDAQFRVGDIALKMFPLPYQLDEN